MTQSDPQRPFANTKIAKFIEDAIERLKPVKSQREIAFALGYSTPNILSMIKRGETKMPLDKIPKLATVLEADPAHLFRLAFYDYLPAIAAAVEEAFGRAATKNEHELFLASWRALTNDRDPTPSPALRAAVQDTLRQLWRSANTT